MASKSWPRFTSPCFLDSSRHLGRHTDSSIFRLEGSTLDERTESIKRKHGSKERLQRASKRSRTSQSPSQERRQSPHLSSTSDKPSTSAAATTDPTIRKVLPVGNTSITESNDLPVLDAADMSKKSSKCKVTCEKAEEQPKKRSRKTPSLQEGPSHTSKSTCHTDNRADFKAKYEEKELLGEGGYALVFAGFHRNNNLPVAIKHIPQEDVVRIPLRLKEKMSNVPLEVALLIAVGAGPDSTASTITPVLLDWFDLDEELIMVLERPVPCMDLIDYFEQRDSYMEEQEAQALQRQLVNAALEMHSKGVFHRDIKLDNILIETGSDVPRVRFIDFGYGTMQIEEEHTVEQGTEVYSSPEWFEHHRYTAGPTTVWQLGVVLYGLLHKRLPFTSPHEIICCNPPIRVDLSDDCKDFLQRCLAKRPQDRPTLESLPNHPWLR
ncbi:serine/threonine-protein kinase pim-1-like isoform X1 [Thunnus thynnus]|uniref:serine/threonine-protein kinase pim-1-like isoform X1 n=1 Tax=Thunnus thynnus TaxID=8237 RepID=UPI003527EBB9